MRTEATAMQTVVEAVAATPERGSADLMAESKRSNRAIPCIFDLDRSARGVCSNVGKRIQLIVSSRPEKDHQTGG